ncbi:MAG: 30S ribosomal protein S18 [Methylacidiphilales bacterium]|nr:30S ribosomal protein S18 [Candidatus Methylacidiphilales bacterium]
MAAPKNKKSKSFSISKSELTRLDYPILREPPKMFDYKDIASLVPFLSETKKILSPKSRFMDSKKQRQLSLAVKRARFIALLPYTDSHSLQQ